MGIKRCFQFIGRNKSTGETTMKFSMNAVTVMGAECYNMEENSGTNLWINEGSEMLTDNQCGNVPSKLKAPYPVFEQIKNEKFPVTLDLSCTQKKGAGNKTEIVVLNFKKTPSSR